MKRLLAALLAGGLLLVQLGADGTHGNIDLAHWATADRPVRLIDSVKGRWQPALDAAALQWTNLLTSPDVTVQASSTKRNKRKRCKFASHAVHVCNFKYGKNKGWAGLAEFSYSVPGFHFQSARIRLNDSTTRGASAKVLQMIACHEIGHTLGLEHSNPDATSCMFTPASDLGVEVPNAHDILVVDALHAHGSPPDGVSYDGAEVTRRGNIVKVKWVLPAPS